MNMREKIEHIIWYNSNINDHAIDITTDTIMKEVFNTDMREKISAIVYEHHEGKYHGAADAIMAALTGETHGTI
jgi:hypothetical protein